MSIDWEQHKPPEQLGELQVSLIREVAERFGTSTQGTPEMERRISLGKDRHVLKPLTDKEFIRNVSSKYYPAMLGLYYVEPSLRSQYEAAIELVLRALRNLLNNTRSLRLFSLPEIRHSIAGRVAVSSDLAKQVHMGACFLWDFRKYSSRIDTSADEPVSGVWLTEDILDFESLSQAWQEEWDRRFPAQRNANAEAPRLSQISAYIGASTADDGLPKCGKWEAVEEIGRGGQGIVYRARDTEAVRIPQILLSIIRGGGNLEPASSPERKLEGAKELAEAILEYRSVESVEFCGALKVLYSPQRDKVSEKQTERMKFEISALKKVSHPNVIRILDDNIDQGWLVTRYFPEGSLARHPERYRGDFLSALVAFRPLVEAVARMHETSLFHRDIKPANVFLDGENLVLGDLGLAYFADAAQIRVTDTLENVGSRDWMPGWAMGMRVEDIQGSFDVFSLGKLLWSMGSGLPLLRLWYLHDDQFELRKMFPSDPAVNWITEILDKCIVERERDCLLNAGELLKLVDEVIPVLRRLGQVVADGVPRLCRVCARGIYTRVKLPTNALGKEAVGFSMAGMPLLGSMFVCDRCRHIEFFKVDS